jgi:quinol-cytochrome oxidoreductase complex cytochrome b subunit
MANHTPIQSNSRVVQWIDSRLPIFSMLSKEYGVFPTPRNFNYFWNFGAIAMFMLVTMIITGLFLAMNYQPSTTAAIDSVEWRLAVAVSARQWRVVFLYRRLYPYFPGHVLRLV